LPQDRRLAVRFLIGFGAMAAVLLGIYYYPHPDGGTFKRALDGYLHGYAVVAATCLRLFEPGIRVIGTDIIGRYSLRIAKTCDAADVNILFLSAVVAWPGVGPRRFLAAGVGIAALFVVNVVRICSLYFVGLHFPSTFVFVHLDAWPMVVVAVTVGMFVAATRWMLRAPA
jgi:exosortase/archaeosortase family protein